VAKKKDKGYFDGGIIPFGHPDWVVYEGFERFGDWSYDDLIHVGQDEVVINDDPDDPFKLANVPPRKPA